MLQQAVKFSSSEFYYLKTLVLGDTHRRPFWKQIVQKEKDFERIIFIVDYFDSLKYTPAEQIDNFLEIIEYKKSADQETAGFYGNQFELSVIELISLFLLQVFACNIVSDEESHKYNPENGDDGPDWFDDRKSSDDKHQQCKQDKNHRHHCIAMKQLWVRDSNEQ